MGRGGAPAPKADDLNLILPIFLTASPVLLHGLKLLLGFQHYLVMLGTTVLIPTALVPHMGGGYEEKAKVIQNSTLFLSISTNISLLCKREEKSKEFTGNKSGTEQREREAKTAYFHFRFFYNHFISLQFTFFFFQIACSVIVVIQNLNHVSIKKTKIVFWQEKICKILRA